MKCRVVSPLALAIFTLQIARKWKFKLSKRTCIKGFNNFTLYILHFTLIINMEELIRYLVASLLQTDEKPNIVIDEKAKEVKIKVTLPSKNYGKLIGKNGKIANAIRIVLKACSNKFYGNKKLYVNIGE